MARCAEQNQIVRRVDIVWARAIHSPRTKLAERDYMSVLRKCAALKCKWMLEKIPIAAAEFAPTSSMHGQQNFCGLRNMPSLPPLSPTSFGANSAPGFSF
jgi:hypothetical protein